MKGDLPAPGSPQAVHRGCECPVMDNGHGKGWMGGAKDPKTGETLFVITASCPLHGEARDEG